MCSIIKDIRVFYQVTHAEMRPTNEKTWFHVIPQKWRSKLFLGHSIQKRYFFQTRLQLIYWLSYPKLQYKLYHSWLGCFRFFPLLFSSGLGVVVIEGFVLFLDMSRSVLNSATPCSAVWYTPWRKLSTLNVSLSSSVSSSSSSSCGWVVLKTEVYKSII